MLLQLKDLASQKLITVPEEGLTFGREGGDAQVQVADMGVSKRHAEVFCEGGAWFLKDLGSSNGTMLANERIADATEILPGDVFQLSKRKFEVLKVVEDDGGGDEEPVEDDGPQMTEPERKAPARPAAKAAAKSAPPPAKKPAGQKMAPAGGREPTRAAPEKGGGGGGDEEMGNASVGQVLAGVPKAIGYYLVNVPLLLVNPFGTVRKAIEEQPRDPMGRMELIAWALPGNIVSGAMSTLAGLIAALIVGGGIGAAIGGLIGGLIVGSIVAVVASVVTGLIWHPLLTWVIEKLFKGESDARGRTNYFLQVQTAIIIAVLPTGLAIIISALRARFGIPLIGLIPVVLSAVTGALQLFVFMKWMEAFNTAKWVKIVALVLLALTALSALAGIPGALAGGGGMATVSTPSGSDGDSAAEDVDDAQKQALENMKAAGATAEQIKAAEDAYKQSKAAMKAAAAASGDAAKAIEEAQKAAAEAQKGAAEAAKGAAEAAKGAAEAAKGAAEAAKPEGKKPPADDPRDDPKPAVAAKEEPETPRAPPAAVAGKGYPAWHTRFENIERAVTEDPTVLRKSAVLKAYQELQELSQEADAKVRKDYKKVDPKTFSHLRDAELYESSGKIVDELHKLIFGR